MFWFEFCSKRFRPGPSFNEVAKYVGNVTMFAYTMKEKNLVRALYTRPRGNGSQSLSRADDW